MYMEVPSLVLLIAALQIVIVKCRECSKLQELGNTSIPYSLNVRDKNGSPTKSEFLCDFIWTDKQHLKVKLLNRLKQRQKTFVRFTVPVMGYSNPYLSMYNASGYLTWAWVLTTHEYMLFYPHNFVISSTLTLGIITQDWAIDYNNPSPVSLKEFGINPNDFDEHDIVGHCDSGCVKVNQSCGIGKYELEEFLLDVTANRKTYEWEWLCLQAPYNVQDIVPVSQFAFPDLLYQLRFLSMLYTSRPWFGYMQNKEDLRHYYCYNNKDECKMKELLMHYWLIPAIGILLWFYSPLLIHYFPSSAPRSHRNVPKDMFPSYKTPIYIGRCIKCILCFYTQKGTVKAKWCVCIRRFILLGLIAVTSFRFFRHHPLCIPLVVCAFIAALIPEYISHYITAELPSKFMFWNIPEELMHKNERLSEYQQLAFVMQERLYLFVNWDFWCFVYEKTVNEVSFVIRWCDGITVCGPILKFLVLLGGSFVYGIVFICYSLYFIIPLPYFCKTLMKSILKGEQMYVKSQQSSSLIWLLVCGFVATCHAVFLAGLLLFTILVMFSWCFALSEFSMFTFIGAVITPDMAYRYFVLVGAVVFGIYKLVSDLHEGYNDILSETVNILKENASFKKLACDVETMSNGKIILVLRKESSNELEYSIVVSKQGQPAPIRQILVHDAITTFVSSHLFNFIVKMCRPLGRQILFITVKIIAILFYSMVALWVKNVYHKEQEVSKIFDLIGSVAVYNIPNVLQFVSYKSNFGKTTNGVLKQQVYDSLVVYFSNLS